MSGVDYGQRHPQAPWQAFASLSRNTNTLLSASLALRYGRALIRGVAPHMRDQAAFLTLGGGAGGRALGSVFLVAICDQHATPAYPHSLGAALAQEVNSLSANDKAQMKPASVIVGPNQRRLSK